jgi:DNA-binding response OmpR family regulator
MRVLVIEDDRSLRDRLAELLQLAGHEVTVAGDGTSGLRLLCEDPLPEAIVLDLMMPKMDGKRFRIAQLADAELALIPTLVVTAAGVDSDLRREIGDLPVLLKPFSMDLMLAALSAIVDADMTSKSCACGRSYDEMTWRDLPLVGEMDNGRDVGERFELRLCACGTTLGWQLGRHAISVEILMAGPRRRDSGEDEINE